MTKVGKMTSVCHTLNPPIVAWMTLAQTNSTFNLHITINANNPMTNSFATKNAGLTLIEVLIAIVILAVLATLAAPSFVDFNKKNRLEALQNRISAALIMARTEAANRGTNMFVCPSIDGLNCAGDANKWANGWIVTSDTDSTANQAVYSYQTQDTSYPVTVVPSTESIEFDSKGYNVSASAFLVKICAPNSTAGQVRAVAVQRSGQVFRSRDGDNDGVHNDPANGTANLTCP